MTPATVTVCAVVPFAGVNVNVCVDAAVPPADTCTPAAALTVSATAAAGSVAKATVYWPVVVPSSLTVSAPVDTVTPATSSSVMVPIAVACVMDVPSLGELSLTRKVSSSSWMAS